MFWSKWKKFLTEVRTELKRTTWPNRTEVRNTTLVVVVTTFIFAAFLFPEGLRVYVAGSGLLTFLTGLYAWLHEPLE